MNASGRRSATALAIGLALLWAPAALAALPPRATDPIPFASVSGVCDPDAGAPAVVASAPVAEAHPSVMTRLSAGPLGGPALWGGPGLAATRIEAGDVRWRADEPLAAGQAGGARVECADALEPISFTVDFFDPARPPVQLRGNGPGGLKLLPRGTTHYVVDVGPVWPDLRIGGTGRPPQAFVASGEYDLGVLNGGVEQQLSVSPSRGSSGSWTIRVRALPVTLSELSLDRPFYRPTDPVTVTLTSSGHTVVSAAVLRPGGRQESLSALGPQPVPPGTHTITVAPWPGSRGPTDGLNRFVLHARDPSGSTSTIETAITYDRTRPVVTVLSPSRLPSPRARFSAEVLDATSGLHNATLLIDDRPVASGASLAYRPRRGWAPGTHLWAVEAADVAGNAVRRQGRFVTPLGNVTRSCNAVRAVHRIRARRVACPRARLTLAAWRRAGFRPRGGPAGYRCAHHTGTMRWRCRRGAVRLAFSSAAGRR